MAPVTRLSVAPLPLAKVTVLPAPIENADQSMIALSELWVISRLPAAGVPMSATPAVTVPPLGRVCWARTEEGYAKRQDRGQQMQTVTRRERNAMVIHLSESAHRILDTHACTRGIGARQLPRNTTCVALMHCVQGIHAAKVNAIQPW